MTDELVSIIIPIYKVEQYLRQCIESVLAQTYSNIEVILVDDGSPDGCGAICDEYAEKDSRVIVIHKENGGVSSARNAGLDFAKGNYIAFVDSDDYVLDSFIINMIEEFDKNPQLDMVISMYYHVITDGVNIDENIEIVRVREDAQCSCSGKDIIINRFGDMRIPYVLAWNKLYRRELFEGVRYEYGAVHEDEMIFRRIMEQCSHIVIIDKPLTYHRIRPGSIMTSYSEVNVECTLRWMTEELKYYREEELYSPLHMLEHMMCHEYVSNKRCMDDDLREQYRGIVKEAIKDLLHAKEVGLKTKLHYLSELFVL